MSTSIRTTGASESSNLLSHPLVLNIITPILLAIIFGAVTVYMTQAATLLRLSQAEATIERNKAERMKEIEELKAEIVPRAEHEAHWKSQDEKLRQISEDGRTTAHRIDEIYNFLLHK